MERIPAKNGDKGRYSKQTTFFITPEMEKQLKDEEKRTGLNRSVLLRAIVEMYFAIPVE
jgi:predicted DNA-binding protein